MKTVSQVSAGIDCRCEEEGAHTQPRNFPPRIMSELGKDNFALNTVLPKKIFYSSFYNQIYMMVRFLSHNAG